MAVKRSTLRVNSRMRCAVFCTTSSTEQAVSSTGGTFSSTSGGNHVGRSAEAEPPGFEGIVATTFWATADDSGNEIRKAKSHRQIWPAGPDEVASWQMISSTELHPCSLLSRFSFAVNAPLSLRHLSSQALHLMGIMKAVV